MNFFYRVTLRTAYHHSSIQRANSKPCLPAPENAVEGELRQALLRKIFPPLRRCTAILLVYFQLVRGAVVAAELSAKA